MAKNRSVEAQMEKILADFANEEQETIEETFNNVAKATKKKLVELSPKDKGDYSRGWSLTKPSKRSKGSTIGGSINITLYNKKHYRLTHLLEKGHVIRNQYGEYGRAPAQPHISKAEEWGVRELLEELEHKL